MAAGTRPDWENVGVELSPQAISTGKTFHRWIRALPREEQVSAFMGVMPAIGQALVAPLAHALDELLEDVEVRKDLLPRFTKTRYPLYVEFVGDDGRGCGCELSVKDASPYFTLVVKDREPDGFGFRFLLRDILTFAEGVLDEGRVVVPDILDFYCRGRMQLIMTKARADWTGFSLFGGLLFYAPEIWATLSREKASGRVLETLETSHG